MESIQITSHPDRRGAFLLVTEQWFPASLETVFPFFADAFNLEEITPPWLHFEVLTPRPFEMCAGRLIDYKLRLHGIPIKWKTEISVWEPPFRFVDRQLKGPYRLWVHEHTFEAYNGGTRVVDRVEYQVLGGALVNTLLVRRDLTRIFSFRRDVLSKRFS